MDSRKNATVCSRDATPAAPSPPPHVIDAHGLDQTAISHSLGSTMEPGPPVQFGRLALASTSRNDGRKTKNEGRDASPSSLVPHPSSLIPPPPELVLYCECSRIKLTFGRGQTVTEVLRFAGPPSDYPLIIERTFTTPEFTIRCGCSTHRVTRHADGWTVKSKRMHHGDTEKKEELD